MQIQMPRGFPNELLARSTPKLHSCGHLGDKLSELKPDTRLGPRTLRLSKTLRRLPEHQNTRRHLRTVNPEFRHRNHLPEEQRRRGG